MHKLLSNMTHFFRISLFFCHCLFQD